MLAPLVSPLPSINIELAAEQLPLKEPRSPFDNILFSVDNAADSYRSQHLLPPPVNSPIKEQPRPTIQLKASPGAGLDPTRFEALKLAARKTQACAPKQDLRKELAIRAHHSKQLERRNRFLSKIEALPSPTAASLPVTPPESPAVFHFTLPSPGLVSPLALFESLDDVRDNRPVRVEQVDFRSLARKEAEALAALTGDMKQSLQVHGLALHAQSRNERKPEVKSTRLSQLLPSLEEISKRLGGNVTIVRSSSPVSRLPAFLQRSVQGNAPPSIPLAAPRPAYANATVKPSLAPSNVHGPIARPTSATGNKAARFPLCPGLVALPGPHIASTRAPTPLTAEALSALAYRAERGTVMMERLQRRFSAPARMGGQAQQRAMHRPVGGF